MRCSHCGSSNFDEDRARADLVCLDCGMVLSENVISSEVEFVETGAGVSSAIGRFVSDESQVMGRESRQVTENKARSRIDTICGHLRLGNDIAVSAFRYYQSALFRGITRGRGALQVAASCVYLAARQLRFNLMLLDLSDAVGVNVYTLGHCYTDLKRRLHLAIPEMDPCLYIERFASQLEFGDKTSIVSTTAMRLLQRMKKDWITTGRRPSGLAAAALLVAARIHEFNRTEADVSRIARISQQTTLKRLNEIGSTPTSALSIEAFFTVDYEEEHDPPAFLAAKKSEETVNELDEAKFSKLSSEINELERRIDCELHALGERRCKLKWSDKLENSNVGRSKGIKHLLEDTSDTEKTDKDVQLNTHQSRNVLREVLDGIVDPSLLDTCVEDLQIITEHAGDQVCEMLRNKQETDELLESKLIAVESMNEPFAEPVDISDTKLDDVKPVKLPSFLPSANMKKHENLKYNQNDGVLSLDGIDDNELENEYLLKPREMMIKAAIWYKSNAEFLHTTRRKRLAKLRQEEEEAKDPSRKRSRKQSGKRRPRPISVYDGGNKFEPNSEDSVDKPISRKINYEALEALVASSSARPSSAITNFDTNSSGALEPGPLLASTLNLDKRNPSKDIDEAPPGGMKTSNKTGVKSVTFAPDTYEPTQTIPNPSLPKASVQIDNQNSVVNNTTEEEFAADGEEEEEELEETVDDFYNDYEYDDPSAWEQGDELW